MGKIYLKIPDKKTENRVDGEAGRKCWRKGGKGQKDTLHICCGLLQCLPLGVGMVTQPIAALAAAPRPASHTQSPVALVSATSMDTHVLARQIPTTPKYFSFYLLR